MKGPVATLKPEDGARFIGPDSPISPWSSVYIKEDLDQSDNNNSNSPDPLKIQDKIELGASPAEPDNGLTNTDLSDGEGLVEVTSSTNGATAVGSPQHDSFLSLCVEGPDQNQDACDGGRITPGDRESKLSPAARNSPEFVSTYIQQLDNYGASQPPPPQWYSYGSSQWSPYGYLPPAPPAAMYSTNYYPTQSYPPGPQSPQQVYSGQHVTYYAAPPPPPSFTHPGWGPPPHSPNPVSAPSPTLSSSGSSGPLPPFSHPQRGSFNYSSPIYHPASSSHLNEPDVHSIHNTHQTSHVSVQGQTNIPSHSPPGHSTHLPTLNGHNTHLPALAPINPPHHVSHQSAVSAVQASIKCEPREVTSTSSSSNRAADQGMGTVGRAPARVFSAALEATCALCGVKFASSGHLKRHLQAHGANRRFRCHACDCAYSRQDNLRKHVAAAHENHNTGN